MRFALIATTVAAAAIIPFAVKASKPQMTGDQFVGAVRCAAYEMVVSPDQGAGAARYRLNAEAQRQPVAVAQQAHAAASEIAHRAATGSLDADQAAVCAV